VTARLAMLAALLATLILVQTVAAPAVAIAGVRPDLVALAVVALGVIDGPGTGARFGFAAGLAVDLAGAGTNLVGISALVLLLVGYAAGLVRPYLTGTGLVGQVAVVAAGTMLALVGIGLLTVLLEVAAVGLEEVFRWALVAGLFNAALAPFAFALLARLTARYPRPAAAPSWPGGRG
jgi:rod shape-determining protein MreD